MVTLFKTVYCATCQKTARVERTVKNATCATCGKPYQEVVSS